MVLIGPSSGFGSKLPSSSSTDHVIKMSSDVPESNGSTDDQSWMPQPFGAFTDKNVRKQFVRKVYSILSVQLLFTVGIGIVFFSMPEVKQFFARQRLYAIGALLVAFIPLIMLSCCESMRRTFPTNFILLTIFTFLQGFAVAAISCVYRSEIVIYALVISTVTVVTVTFLSTLPCVDITKCGGLLFALLIAHMFMGIALYGFMFFTKSSLQPYQLGYAVLGALIFMLYLAYDTQLILGGRKHEMSPEEYILGAICLYLDIINIFLYTLQIMNITSR